MSGPEPLGVLLLLAKHTRSGVAEARRGEILLRCTSDGVSGRDRVNLTPQHLVEKNGGSGVCVILLCYKFLPQVLLYLPFSLRRGDVAFQLVAGGCGVHAHFPSA